MEGAEEQQQKPSLVDIWRDIQGHCSWEGLLDPLDPILKSEILRYGDFVNACYSAKKNDRILSEKLVFQESDNLKGCGYEIKAYIYANVPSLRSYFGHKSMHTGLIGFIAVCTDTTEIRRLGRRDIVVAFRGTSEPREWIQNLRHKVDDWPYLPGTASEPNVGVHNGFLGVYKDKGLAKNNPSARKTVETEIAKLLAEYERQTVSITVTGHSLGGALATMSAYDIRLLWPSIPVTVFTFASPRVGNRAFANHIRNIGVKVLRVEVKSDLVPGAPGVLFNEKSQKSMFSKKIVRKLEYCHVGINFPLDIRSSDNLSWRDKHFRNHGLNIHLHLIDGYQGSGQPFQSSHRGRKYLVKEEVSGEVSCENDF